MKFYLGNNEDPENPAGKIEDSKLSSSLKLIPLKKLFSKKLFVICGVVIRAIRLIVLELLKLLFALFMNLNSDF
ncbi:hypothetical protein C1645_838609 [Glomus cerebriforme]|uniref:Uncharacterized protein n=1 Tax=Glomus cerebriforme TaxID=658196 RepID=A0A397SCM5_9GLOM|nr:hypothetical protein C1645_838609 [Glomus cerebriforme]